MKKSAKKGFVLAMVTGLFSLLSGCAGDSMEAEYAAIRDSGLSGEALLNGLSEFELRNIGHFNSKIDLGGYYLLSGDIDRAEDYFRRVEALTKKAPGDGDTQKNITIMYGSLARIHSLQGEYDTALEWIIALDKDGIYAHRAMEEFK
jgi:tetratricopeptide (TPR) repeat protein